MESVAPLASINLPLICATGRPLPFGQALCVSASACETPWCPAPSLADVLGSKPG